MIVAASAKLREQYRRREEAQRVRDRVAQIASTRKKLEELEPVLRESIEIFSRIQDRIPTEEQTRFCERFRQLEGIIRQSHTGFATERRQVTRLEEATAAARNIIDDLHRTWRQTSNSQVQPYRDLLVLVRQLPVVAPQAQALQSALRDLEPSTAVAPRTDADLARFKHRLAEIERKGQAFAGLPAEVRDFLQRVTERTATLGDLNPNVMEWLRAQGHLQSFLIRFSGDST